MTDETQPRPEDIGPEEQPVSEPEPAVAVEPRSVVEDDDEDTEPITAEELREEMHEISERARSAGLRPFRRMIRAYVDQTLDAVDGLLSALEGKKKKGD